MNVKELIRAVKVSYKIKRPLLALSSPGVGKSSAVYQAASSLSKDYDSQFSVIEVRASTSNPAELSDIKAVIDGKVVDLQQDWVPTKEKVDRGECSSRGMIFLDEIADGTATVQSALQQLLLDRRLGGARLAEGWGTVAASNRAGDKAAAGRLSTALVNRCMTVTIDPDTEVFIQWGLSFGIVSDIIAFCRWRPSPWNFDPSAKNQNPAFCSPRSMHILSDLLKEDPNPHPELITGIIGDGVGSEFAGFLRIKDEDELPDLNAILRDPQQSMVPKKMDVAIATLYAVMARINDNNMVNALKYFSMNEIELAMAAFKDLYNQRPEMAVNRVVIDWMSRPENTRMLTFGFGEK